MPQFTVYHNPVFLTYRGDHRQIPPPTQPVATVTVSDDLTPAAGLEFAYARTQHRDRSWFNDPQVLPHLRSTSPGDLIAGPDGELHVVELVGFQPYRWRARHVQEHVPDGEIWIDGAGAWAVLAPVEAAEKG